MQLDCNTTTSHLPHLFAFMHFVALAGTPPFQQMSAFEWAKSYP